MAKPLHRFVFRNFVLVKEHAGLISPGTCWVLLDCKEGYMYSGDNLFKLAKNTIKEWRQDSALVG